MVRTHESHIAHYLLSNVNMGVRPTDKVMLVMPMCHVNSIQYSFPYTLVSAPVFVYKMASFDPEDLLRTIHTYRITYTSLVPTHYRMILDLPGDVKDAMDVSSIRQLLISSAPAGAELKREIMDYFKNAELWEAYGSSGRRPGDSPEARGTSSGSWVPSARRSSERTGSGCWTRTATRSRTGRWGSSTPGPPAGSGSTLRDPEKTAEVFDGEWFSAGDMGRRDEDGYLTLVDREGEHDHHGRGERLPPRRWKTCFAATRP